MILQNIWMRVVGIDLENIIPSIIFLNMLLPGRFYQICQAAFGLCG